MTLWKRLETVEIDSAVFRGVDIDPGGSVSILTSTISPDANGEKTLAAGHTVSRVGNAFRFTPRSKVSAAFTTGAATGTLSNWKVFRTGDVLRIVEPYATITLAGTYGNTDTVTVTVQGIALAVTTGSTVLADIAATVAAAINASSALSPMVTAIASGAIIYLFANDGITLYSLAATENAASGTATASGSALAYGAALGTISTISTAGVITLGANAAMAVPVGANVGVVVDEVLGIYGHSIDATLHTSVDIAYVAEAQVYTGALPYLDGDIKRQLSNIQFALKF